MLVIFTVKYTRTTASYMGQIVEWSEIVIEGKTLQDCRKVDSC